MVAVVSRGLVFAGGSVFDDLGAEEEVAVFVGGIVSRLSVLSLCYEAEGLELSEHDETANSDGHVAAANVSECGGKWRKRARQRDNGRGVKRRAGPGQLRGRRRRREDGRRGS